MPGLHAVGSRRSKLMFAGSVYLGLIGMTAVFLFPLLWVIGLSLKTRLQVFAMPPLFVWQPTLENYAAVLGRRTLPAGVRQQPGRVVWRGAAIALRRPRRGSA